MVIYLITLRGISSVNYFFKPRSTGPSHQGRGVGAPSELLTCLPPPSQHPLPSAMPASRLPQLESIALPSCLLLLPHNINQPTSHRVCPAWCQQHKGTLGKRGGPAFKDPASCRGSKLCTVRTWRRCTEGGVLRKAGVWELGLPASTGNKDERALQGVAAEQGTP